MTFLPAVERANLPCADWLSFFCDTTIAYARAAYRLSKNFLKFFKKPFRFAQARCVLDKRGGAKAQAHIC